MNMKSKPKNIKKLVGGKSTGLVNQKERIPVKKKEYVPADTKISIKKDGVFIGYKADTFWSVCDYDGKRHPSIQAHLIKNLLYILNTLDYIKYYPYDGANIITLELVDNSNQIKETVEIIKNNAGVYQVKGEKVNG